MRILVADDEPLVRAAVRDALAAEPDVEIVGECGDGEAALRLATELRPDVLFLDVQMPGLTGLDVAERLDPSLGAAVVFVTAYDHYAVRAFELASADYVLKPFEPARVRAALARVRERREGDAVELRARLDALLAELRAGPPSYLARFVASLAGRLRVIPVEDVIWIEAADNYVQVHTAAGSALVRETMKTLEARLDPARFVRVHRSAIVAIGRVRELRPLDSGDYKVVLDGGHATTMSRTYRDEVLRRIHG
jgi:two-component system LytT family response regulator